MSSENKVSAENNTLTESKKNSKAGSNKHRSGKSKSKKTRKNCVVLRYILPFYLKHEGDLDFDRIHSSVSADPAWEETDAWIKDPKTGIHTSEQDLYDYIIKQFSFSDDSTNIGCVWKYNNVDSLPEVIYKAEDKSDRKIHFTDMGLYLFRTGIGLLWYEINASSVSGSVKELIRFQNSFKELCSTRHTKERQNKLRFIDEDGFETELILGKILDGILNELPFEQSYFAMRRLESSKGDTNGPILPDKAILYNYLAVPASENDVPDHDPELSFWAFCFANGYSDLYLTNDDLEESFYRPFRNEVWNVTNEGCSCCVKYTNMSNGFFTGSFPQRIRGDYFLTYILLLHQHYSLLNYATWVQKNMSADGKTYRDSPEKSKRKLEKMLLDMNTFLSKNIYASVSHITTQNEFYLYGLSRLHIRENISSINLGTDAIVEMLNVQENAREADADRKANLLFGSLSILVVFSALTDMAALFDVAGAWQSAKMPLYYIFLVIIIGLGLFAFYGFLKNIFSRKKE